jgi:Cu/Ag efflux pump CusA
VDQVRNDLPPEAEVPTINVESADSQFASAYLSFTSDILKQNEITDYLVRIVQPRLSALAGVQRADILGARTFAMRIWLKPERMAAFNISPLAQVRRALAANNFMAAVGRTKGALVQVNLTANTDLRSVEEFKRLVVRQQGGALVIAWKTSATWCWAPKTTTRRCAFPGRPPSLWASGPCPTPIRWTSSKRSTRRWRLFPDSFPAAWTHGGL